MIQEQDLQHIKPGDIIEVTENTGACYTTKFIDIRDNSTCVSRVICGELIACNWNGMETHYEEPVKGDHPLDRITKVVKIVKVE